MSIQLNGGNNSNSLFQQIVLGQIDIHKQKNEFEPPNSYHIQKLTQKWVRDLKLKL